MRDGDPEIVSASEIASWAWCPESWRLSSLGHEPANRAALERGANHHARESAFEVRSRSAISLGGSLLVASLLLAALAFVLMRS